MVSLRNSKSSQHVTVQQLSEAIALGSYELNSDDTSSNVAIPKDGAKSFLNFPASTSKLLSKKKLRWKTKVKHLSMLAKAAEDNSEDDDNLNNTVNHLINPGNNAEKDDTLKNKPV